MQSQNQFKGRLGSKSDLRVLILISSQLPAWALAALREQRHGTWHLARSQVIELGFVSLERNREGSIHCDAALRRSAKRVDGPVAQIEHGKRCDQFHNNPLHPL